MHSLPSPIKINLLFIISIFTDTIFEGLQLISNFRGLLTATPFFRAEDSALEIFLSMLVARYTFYRSLA
jgi:hypothetical protein